VCITASRISTHNAWLCAVSNYEESRSKTNENISRISNPVSVVPHKYALHRIATLLKEFCPSSNRFNIQGGSNMTGTNCDLFTHGLSWSYLNHLLLVHLQCQRVLRDSVVHDQWYWFAEECIQYKKITVMCHKGHILRPKTHEVLQRLFCTVEMVKCVVCG
jgi:hypothetical protein